MQVKELITGRVAVVQPDATLQSAAEKMQTTDQGLLPVWDGERLVGVITEHDIVGACAEGSDPIRTRVHEAMTPNVLSCYDDEDLADAAEKMDAERIHRLLVLSRDGEPRGVVSLADLAVAADDDRVTQSALQGIAEPKEPPPLG